MGKVIVISWLFVGLGGSVPQKLTFLDFNDDLEIAQVQDAVQALGFPLTQELTFVKTPLPGKRIGQTHLGTPTNVRCKIELAPHLFNPDLAPSITTVVWHEYGHCIGLNHAPTANRIMSSESGPFPSYSPIRGLAFRRTVCELTRAIPNCP